MHPGFRFARMYRGQFEGFFAWGMNPACSSPGAGKVREALGRLKWPRPSPRKPSRPKGKRGTGLWSITEMDLFPRPVQALSLSPL